MHFVKLRLRTLMHLISVLATGVVLPRAGLAPIGRTRALHATASTSALEAPPLQVALDDAIAHARTFINTKYQDAPVTNLTLSLAAEKRKKSTRSAQALARQVEEAAAALEGSDPSPLDFGDASDARLSLVSGTWRLKYSNAAEITNLAKLPLGLRLRTVLQRVDLDRGVLENRAEVAHKWRLAAQRTRVVAKAWADEPGALNKVGVPNPGNRLAVKFCKVVVSLRRLLLLPTPFLRIVARPFGPVEKEGRVPTLDVTFVSQSTRISRGGDGSLFVLERVDDPPEPLEEADDVVDSRRAFDGATGAIGRLPSSSQA